MLLFQPLLSMKRSQRPALSLSRPPSQFSSRSSTLRSGAVPPTASTANSLPKTASGKASASARRDLPPNAAPSQWARRLARAVGAAYGVRMSPNHARNEGEWGGRDVVIKCAKSPAPPVSVLMSMVDRLDELWAVFVMPSGEAEVWRVPVATLQRHGYLTQGRNVTPRLEITRRKVSLCGELLGVLDRESVEACRIP
jgi:hypothetical protein